MILIIRNCVRRTATTKGSRIVPIIKSARKKAGFICGQTGGFPRRVRIAIGIYSR